MKFKRALFFFTATFLLLFAYLNQTVFSQPISDTLRNQAVEELKSTLTNESRWIRVHAAEYLLELGYFQDVRDIFIQEERKFGDESPYRIGIWRVLTKASMTDAEREKWIQNIVDVYKDPSSEDRNHAAETLAKLDVSPYTDAPGITREILNKEFGVLQIFTTWGTQYSLPDITSNFSPKAQLLNILKDKSENQRIRKLSAYALRHIEALETSEWDELTKMALAEPDTSVSKMYMLAAAFVNTPKDSIQTDEYARLKNELLEAQNSQRKADRQEMILALANGGSEDDLPVLVSILNNERPIEAEGIENIDEVNTDIRAVAAYAILKIDRRKEYTLATLDWIIIALYLISMLLIGWYFSLKNESPIDYFLGGGNMNPLTVGLSLFASLLSSLSYLAYPGEMIKYGPVIFVGVLAMPLVYYVVGWFLIPRFMEMKVTSAYEYLEQRLGLSVRMLATFFFLSLRFMWMATITYITVNIAIIPIVNIDPSYATLITGVLVLITILYTSMGGLKAVVLTDALQTMILLGGAILTVAIISIHFGSATEWIPNEWLSHWSPFRIGFDTQERLTVGNAMLTLFVWYLCTAGSDQMAIQRYLATKDVKAARKTFGVSLITNFVVRTFLGVVGLALLAFFLKNPHYLADNTSVYQQADQLFPRFILVGLPIGISGLVAAGLIAAAMSSLSSGLNASSSVISEDFIQRFRSKNKPKTSHKDQLQKIRKISYAVGVLILIMSIGVGYVQGNLIDIIFKVVNLFVAPLFVLFFLGLFVPFATARGTFIGGLFAVVVAIAIAFFQIFGIQVLWIMPLSLVGGAVAGVVVSYTDKELLVSQ